ncbi:hypothetical protein [Winogradskyella flava]|uniref:Uncharacterized protein n=1 Tax=Winogradskyella flava TaxID=1884876 RepID=A0A842IV41_9FLAO|nr:hypothetical protein [Winogradskyella flava]MBC2845999.1 hypothetical protein [Winogradskyella flava]
MEFEIKRIITIEFSDDKLKVDLNNLGEYISKRLSERDYGSSVVKYFWGFELFKFDGGFAQFFRNEIESWKHSVKWFVTNSNLDWNEVHKMNELQTLKLIKNEILSSIKRIEKMKRKPKDFDYKNLILDLEKILTEYIENNIVQQHA